MVHELTASPSRHDPPQEPPGDGRESIPRPHSFPYGVSVRSTAVRHVASAATELYPEDGRRWLRGRTTKKSTVRPAAGADALGCKSAVCLAYPEIAVKQPFSFAFWKGDWY